MRKSPCPPFVKVGKFMILRVWRRMKMNLQLDMV